jgi:hypothetical protein
MSDVKLQKQVFHIHENSYTYGEARKLAENLQCELASYSQILNSYKQGANWCNYGWSKDQLALYPSQLRELIKIQNTNKQGNCGDIGINGGFFAKHNKFGINCYGLRPDILNLGQDLKIEYIDFENPPSQEEIDYVMGQQDTLSMAGSIGQEEKGESKAKANDENKTNNVNEEEKEEEIDLENSDLTSASKQAYIDDKIAELEKYISGLNLELPTEELVAQIDELKEQIEKLKKQKQYIYVTNTNATCDDSDACNYGSQTDCDYPEDRKDCTGKDLYCENTNACNYDELGNCSFHNSRTDCQGNPLYCTDSKACNYGGGNGSCLYHGSRMDCAGNPLYCENSKACNFDKMGS